MDYEIDRVTFEHVEYREGKFKLNGIVYDSPLGEAVGAYNMHDVMLVQTSTGLWRYDIPFCSKICDANSNIHVYTDSVRMYVWVGNMYTCIQDDRTTAKCVEEYFQQCFGPWYFNNGVWKHVISNRSVYGGYDVEYATYSTIQTIQVNNGIISDGIVKLSMTMNRRALVEILRRYIQDGDRNAAVRSLALEFQFPGDTGNPGNL